MKYIYLTLLFILPFASRAQKDVEILNDSFFIISYNKVNSIKERTESLKKQVEILSQYAIVCDTATKKAINKELWYDQEVDKWIKMDSILREKIDRSVIIMNNYDKLLIISQEQLKASEKQKKNAVAWKNVYKPIAIGSLLYIGLNLLLK